MGDATSRAEMKQTASCDWYLSTVRLASHPGEGIRRVGALVTNRWFLASVLLCVAVSSPVRMFPDSGGYLTTGADAFGQFSFTGKGIRAWPTVLLFRLGPTVGVLLQYVIYFLAVALLLGVFARLTSGRTRTCLLVGLMLLLLNRNTVQWHSIVLSESLTLSLTLIGVALLFSFVLDKPRFLFGLTAVVFAGLMVVNRPTMAPLFLLISVTIPIVEFRRGRRLSALTLSLLAVVSLSYATIVNHNIDNFWSQGSSGFTRSSVSFVFLTADEIPAHPLAPRARQWPSDVLFSALVEDAGVPPCLTSIRSSWIDCPYCFQQEIADSCPRDVVWINEEFSTWYAKLLVSRLDRTVLMSALSLGFDASKESRYAFPWSPVPPLIEKMFTGAKYPIPIPPLPLWFGAVMVAMAKRAVARRSRPAAGIAGDRGRFATVWLTLVASTLSVMIPTVVLPAELDRTASSAMVGIYVSLLLLLALILQSAGSDGSAASNE